MAANEVEPDRCACGKSLGMSQDAVRLRASRPRPWMCGPCKLRETLRGEPGPSSCTDCGAPLNMSAQACQSRRKRGSATCPPCSRRRVQSVSSARFAASKIPRVPAVCCVCGGNTGTHTSSALLAAKRGYSVCQSCSRATRSSANGRWFSSLTPAEQEAYTHSLTLPPDAPRPPGTPVAPRDRVLAAVARATAATNGGAS